MSQKNARSLKDYCSLSIYISSGILQYDKKILLLRVVPSYKDKQVNKTKHISTLMRIEITIVKLSIRIKVVIYFVLFTCVFCNA